MSNDTVKVFDKLFRKISVNQHYIKPDYPRLDNWWIDRWETGTLFATMSGQGYTRSIGMRSPEGKVTWRIDEPYPKPLEYHGISEEEFLEIAKTFG